MTRRTVAIAMAELACGAAHLACGAPQPTGSVPAPKAEWPLWNAFAENFVDAQGRVVDRDAADRTTSEGQAYSLFFALVANDRTRFDRILEWTVNNLAQGDLTRQLPAWLWGVNTSKTAWAVADPNSASDADLWIAYTLIEAGRLWSSQPLHELGVAVARRMENEEVGQLAGFGAMMVPGKTGFRTAEAARLNASYLPPQLLQRLAHETPEAHWGEVLNGVPAVWAGGSVGGYVADWAEWQKGKGFSAWAPGGAEPKASYDAIRVYLWAGMLPPKFPDRERFLEPLMPMVRHLRTHAAPPESILAAGELAAEGGIGFSAALIPLLSSLGEVATVGAQKQRVQKQFDPASRLYGRPARYYDQCLVLFSQGWSENRFRFDETGQLIVRWGVNP